MGHLRLAGHGDPEGDHLADRRADRLIRDIAVAPSARLAPAGIWPVSVAEARHVQLSEEDAKRAFRGAHASGAIGQAEFLIKRPCLDSPVPDLAASGSG